MYISRHSLGPWVTDLMGPFHDGKTLSKETFKTTIKHETLQLCNFLTIHSHGSILGSFESQETRILFSRPKICVMCVRRIPTTPDRCMRLPPGMS